MYIQVESTLDIDVRRGDVWLCDLSGAAGSEQSGLRPCLIIQNSRGNRVSPCVIVTTITAQINKKLLPTHTIVSEGFDRDSVIQAEQIRTLDKGRLICKLTSVSQTVMNQINKTLALSIGLMGEEVYR